MRTASTATDDLASSLNCNKSFFAEKPLRCKNELVVAKSVVWVEEGEGEAGQSSRKGKRVARQVSC